jgi:hypothetical protein
VAGQSDIELDNISVVVFVGILVEDVLGIGLRIGGRRGSIQIGGVPHGELVAVHITERRDAVRLGVVGPDLADIQVLHEGDWVPAPELLSRDQSAWRHN